MKKSLMYESEKKQSNWNSFGDSTSSHKTLGFKQYRADSICVYMPYLRFDLTENGIWLTSRDSLLQDIYIYMTQRLPIFLTQWGEKEPTSNHCDGEKQFSTFLLYFVCLGGCVKEHTKSFMNIYPTQPTPKQLSCPSFMRMFLQSRFVHCTMDTKKTFLA